MNIRQVPPDMQAVVMRLGAIDRVQQSGLVIAWPRPIERVMLVPGPAQQMRQQIERRTAGAGAGQRRRAVGRADHRRRYLTGDGGVVMLDATLTWRITDAAAYVLAEQHIAPALRRAAEGAASPSPPRVRWTSSSSRSRNWRTRGAQAAREALRAAFAAEVNRRLHALDASGVGFGIEVTRADVSAYLPASAKVAFDHVLTAGQMAEQGIALARTGAERRGRRGCRRPAASSPKRR